MLYFTGSNGAGGPEETLGLNGVLYGNISQSGDVNASDRTS